MVSLYSGAGGLDLGFRQAGYELEFANDLDPLARESYSLVHSDAPGQIDHEYVVGDLSADFSVLGRRESSVLVGGPPCQGFSRAGRMNPSDPRSRHVRAFIQAAESMRPRAFVMENVRALATHPRWTSVLDTLKDEAHLAGYETTTLLLNARDYGVPQSRERMFLIGYRRGDLDVDILRRPVGLRRSSVRSALQALGHPGPTWQQCRARIVPALAPVIRRSPFAGMMFNGQGRPLDLDGVAPTISASLGGNHTPIVDQLWLDNPDERGLATRTYHHQVVSGGHAEVPTSWRRISLREAAALQGFPDVAWDAPLSARFRHVGNAVPPPLAQEVATRLRLALGSPAMATPDKVKLGGLQLTA
ncbi:DNA cytosine methyltransferase [Microbacterium sp. JC 701]|uniref:DNA cytosine methyltransferase n=1 Tax=Microbacterium sp. JC 701 TaxID=2897389 RepID=UPI001E60FD8F|nr:DNA cytosine methyltransferase [Microbacterium sp. JC 701]MCD2171237.1 DNA cytosine methyltransferase [Microbacterium sp. JC 701]